ncbi:DUF3858 domain-containing protein [Pontibacter cellulosilyticus]|uniref:DUF3857 domain-containing protein n=1 Tax=Pontibacter cellulosilyticus TaxID=1720253 RepID=A0A923N7I7_9BACT|nr:DUF3857 domain-containing protein [Pontibacter cellulosilyticus]MBC5993648.1 DUF3857 domain-containing protein [Pontibacter cellulosilyticus]
MKTKFTLTSLFLLCCFICYAQNPQKRFGKVEEAELRMMSYDKDTSAAAVILYDHGSTKFAFNEKIQVVFERHIRIKILKKAGYDWANVTVPYYINGTTKEKVSNIKAYTFNLVDGKEQKVKLESKDVFDEKQSEYKHLKKFSLPNVKEGSVLDINYTIYSDFVYTMREWEFQHSIPVVYSEYRAQIPEYFDYKFLMQGYLSVDDTKQSSAMENITKVQNNEYYWIMKDVPALKGEKYITTLSDYQSKIEFELERVRFPNEPVRVMTGNWDDVTKKLLENEDFGIQLKRNGFFKETLAALMAKNKEPEQQMNAIYELVRKRMTWNGKYGIYTKDPIRKVYESGTGSVPEINLLMTSMLLEAGLDASPVLLSTRDNGQLRHGPPMLTKFNYVVTHVKIGDKEYFLDATEPLLPAGMLPVRCLNGMGRLVKKTDHRWVDIKPASNYIKLFSADLAINNQGDITGTGTESAGGYNALYMRKTIKEEGEDKYMEKLAKEVGNLKVGKPKIENLNELGNSLNLTYNLTAGGSGQVNDVIYLNPMMGHGEKENPFKLKERMYPVDFATPIDETYICRFTLPEGYEIDEAPKNIAVNLPEGHGRFMYLVEREGNQVQIMSKININKAVFYATEYPYLKEFYNQIVAKHAEQLVIKKVATASR